MKKSMIVIGCAVSLLISIVIFYDYALKQKEDALPPNKISSYQKTGYFMFDPSTIVASLKNRNTNVFVPIQEEEALVLEAIPNLSIQWMQTEYLDIASAVGNRVWNDPMALNEWKIYDIFFDGSCSGPIKLNSILITYFKPISNGYTTRFIEIEPSFGWARWGGEETYSQPLLGKWKGIDLSGSRVTADKALQVASEDAKSHSWVRNICGAYISASLRKRPKEWDVAVFNGGYSSIKYFVDMETDSFVLITPGP